MADLPDAGVYKLTWGGNVTPEKSLYFAAFQHNDAYIAFGMKATEIFNSGADTEAKAILSLTPFKSVPGGMQLMMWSKGSDTVIAPGVDNIADVPEPPKPIPPVIEDPAPQPAEKLPDAPQPATTTTAPADGTAPSQ